VTDPGPRPLIPASATPAERQIIRLLFELNLKADVIMAAQDDINTAVATIADGTTQIVTATTAISAALAADQPVDTSALNAALPPFVQAVQALTAAVPPPPAPPATGTTGAPAGNGG